MKNYLLIFSLFISSFNLLANFDVCENQGENFGKLNEIDFQCLSYAKRNAPDSNYFKGDKVEAFAYNNILFIQYKTAEGIKDYKIAGDKTFLHDIKSIHVTKDQNTVYVLDQNNILEFDTMTSGNSAPKRLLNIKNKECSQMTINDQDQEYFLLCGQKIVYGKIDGDSRYKKLERKPSSIQQYIFKSQGDRIIKLYKGDLLVLDKVKRNLSAFNFTEQREALWQIDLDTQLNGTLQDLSVREDKIIVTDDLNKQAVFN
ncbi:MAG: hypothetical protein CME65_12580 [Halobacteriovoraceae bacterium]|nr:hypothetical protein [Halobacteriovoraceae bacterium]